MTCVFVFRTSPLCTSQRCVSHSLAAQCTPPWRHYPASVCCLSNYQKTVCTRRAGPWAKWTWYPQCPTLVSSLKIGKCIYWINFFPSWMCDLLIKKGFSHSLSFSLLQYNFKFVLKSDILHLFPALYFYSSTVLQVSQFKVIIIYVPKSLNQTSGHPMSETSLLCAAIMSVAAHNEHCNVCRTKTNVKACKRYSSAAI